MYVYVRVLYVLHITYYVMKMIDLRPPLLCHFLIVNYHSYTLLALLAMMEIICIPWHQPGPGHNPLSHSLPVQVSTPFSSLSRNPTIQILIIKYLVSFLGFYRSPISISFANPIIELTVGNTLCRLSSKMYLLTLTYRLRIACGRMVGLFSTNPFAFKCTRARLVAVLTCTTDVGIGFCQGSSCLLWPTV